MSAWPTATERGPGGVAFNELLAHREDYALARVPLDGRRSLYSVSQVALAIPTALVFLATGGSLWASFGTGPLIAGVVVACLVIGFAGFTLTTFACRSGLDSDLTSIWAGYGLRGSAVASFIYTGNFVVLFALEDGIVVNAVHARLPSIPSTVILLALAATVLAITWYGVARLHRVMTSTLPLFLGLLGWIVVKAFERTPKQPFWSFHVTTSHNGVPAILAVNAALLAFVVNATVGADIGRFLRPQDRARGGLLIGVVLQIVCFGLVMLLGAWLTYRLGGASDPGGYVVGLTGIAGLLFVLISQTRINSINTYAGSLSGSNFGKRAVNRQPGRHVWAIIVVSIATILALNNLYSNLINVLTFEAVFVAGWASTLVTYVITSSEESYERALSSPITKMGRDKIGLFALLPALICAVPLAFGVAGEFGKALAPVLAIVLAAIGVWAQSTSRSSAKN